MNTERISMRDSANSGGVMDADQRTGTQPRGSQLK